MPTVKNGRRNIMKKIIVLVFTMIFAAGFMGCTEMNADQAQNAVTDATNTGVINPWQYDVTADDVASLTGKAFPVPEAATDVTYAIMEEKKMGEMRFKLDGKEYIARMQPATDFEDISGLFYEWDAEETDSVAGFEALNRKNLADNISNVLWNDGSMMYSLYTADGTREDFDIAETADLLFDSSAETCIIADYDMYGFVVDKLPEEEYYNHYNVKGDNDEIFICNYNGEDELAAGTYVGMWQIEDGWTIEVIPE